jgi:hypothetical protein
MDNAPKHNTPYLYESFCRIHRGLISINNNVVMCSTKLRKLRVEWEIFVTGNILKETRILFKYCLGMSTEKLVKLMHYSSNVELPGRGPNSEQKW